MFLLLPLYFNVGVGASSTIDIIRVWSWVVNPIFLSVYTFHKYIFYAVGRVAAFAVFNVSFSGFKT